MCIHIYIYIYTYMYSGFFLGAEMAEMMKSERAAEL